MKTRNKHNGMRTVRCRTMAVWAVLWLAVPFGGMAQDSSFEAMADRLNRIAVYRKADALAMLDSMCRMADLSPDSLLQTARCLYEEALLNLRQGIVDSSLTSRIESRLAASRQLSLPEQALLESTLGKCLMARGEYTEAFTVTLQASEKFGQAGCNRFMARELNSLGYICYACSVDGLARHYFQEAIRYATPDSYDYYQFKSNLFYIDQSPSTADSLLSLIETMEQKQYVELLPVLYLNTGAMFLATSPEKVVLFFDKIRALDFDNPKIEASMHNNSGYRHLKRKEPELALDCFRKAQQIMETNNDFQNLQAVYSNISSLFESRQMLDSALFYSKRHREVVRHITASSAVVETHHKYISNLMESSRKELIIAEQAIQLKNRQLILIVTVLTFSAALFWVLVRQQKLRWKSENMALTAKLEYEREKTEHEKQVHEYREQQQKLEKEKQNEILDAKCREIASYSLLVSDKNHLLKQIRELNNRKHSSETAAKIEEIIRSNLNVDGEWENFKLHFDRVAPRFFEKLKLFCSDLTEDNLRMCAYIKIGMTLKQIAQLLHISHKSVISNRYRLKKKLHLAESESIADFIGKL